MYLQNFRCFDRHMLELRPMTIIVGANNSGKSTAIEALRLVSLIANRYRFLNYTDVPAWLFESRIPKIARGVAPSLKGIEFNALSVFHNLAEPPATIRACFQAGSSMDIYLGPKGAIHAVLQDQEQRIVSNRAKAQRILLPKVSILPQIAPVAAEEQILDPDYVRSATSPALASLHFRNQINLYPEYFDDFKSLSESTWPNLKIRGLEKRSSNPHEPLALFVQDHDFVAEIAWMGHGLQMWLQTMWFLARSKDSPTIILDEPDVYLHADLQRKLIRLLKGRHEQVIVATHSTEIMAEVESRDVLVIDRMSERSIYASSIPSVQHVIDKIGSVHNLQLARLWTSRRCLFVEGKDLDFLKIIQNIMFPRSHDPIDSLPNIQLGGWGGWNYVFGSKLLLRNAGGDVIRAYCLFDSDYHAEEEIEERYRQAQEREIQLHIWSKKEIENYLIVPDAIQRLISERLPFRQAKPTTREIAQQIDLISEELKDATFDAISAEIHSKNRASGVTAANRRARAIIDTAWISSEGRWSVVSGKSIIASLSAWSQGRFMVSLSPTRILREMKSYEIDPEVRHVMMAIERGLSFGAIGS